MINYEITNGVFDKFLIFASEIFLDFGIKRGVRKLPQSFFLVKVGPQNNYRAAFVGRFDNYVIAFTKIFERRPLFRGKVGKFSVTIEFKFVNVMTAFFGEKLERGKLSLWGSPFRFANLKCFKNIFVRSVRIILFVMKKGF